MTVSDLRNAVEEIELDEGSRQRIIRNLRRMQGKNRYHRNKMLKGAVAAEGQEFYFLIPESRFYLPEGRELTDEEILQIIDFNEMRNYALLENAAERNAAAAAQIVADGGISKQESITLTGEYLQSIFGVDAGVMEGSSYFNEAVPEGESIWDEAYYNVHWEGQDGELYSFSIRADDGMLLSAKPIFTGTETEQDKPAVLDAAKEAALIKAEAEDFLRNTININEVYDRVEICYYIYNGAEVSDTVDVTFLKANGDAYQVTYTWNHEVKECVITTAEIYESVIEYNAESLAEKQGGNVIVEVVRE